MSSETSIVLLRMKEILQGRTLTVNGKTLFESLPRKHEEELRLLPVKKARGMPPIPLMANGVRYPDVLTAAHHLGVSQPTIRKRLASKRYPKYYSLPLKDKNDVT